MIDSQPNFVMLVARANVNTVIFRNPFVRDCDAACTVSASVWGPRDNDFSKTTALGGETRMLKYVPYIFFVFIFGWHVTRFGHFSKFPIHSLTSLGHFSRLRKKKRGTLACRDQTMLKLKILIIWRHTSGQLQVIDIAPLPKLEMTMQALDTRQKKHDAPKI